MQIYLHTIVIVNPIFARVQLVRTWCTLYLLLHLLFIFILVTCSIWTTLFWVYQLLQRRQYFGSMERFRRCLFLVQQMGLSNILQTTVAVCKLAILLYFICARWWNYTNKYIEVIILIRIIIKTKPFYWIIIIFSWIDHPTEL